ncbi:MAG: hypothetical protein ABWW69_01320 [Pyrodictiaceae archaeon]
MAKPSGMSLAGMVISILEESGGKIGYEELVERLRSIVARERLGLRFFSHPSGRFWSPELNEAIKTLAFAGILEVHGDELVLKAGRSRG